MTLAWHHTCFQPFRASLPNLYDITVTICVLSFSTNECNTVTKFGSRVLTKCSTDHEHIDEPQILSG